LFMGIVYCSYGQYTRINLSHYKFRIEMHEDKRGDV
jgi:hypothetical protein